MKTYNNQTVFSRTHLIELLAEAKNFNETLRKLKDMKYAYKLSDGSYLFGWSISGINESCQSSIDWDSIEIEARELRKKLKRIARAYFRK